MRIVKLKISINNIYKQAKQSKNRYRIIYGGAGSGKSHYIAQEAILNMLSSGQYQYLAVRKTGKSIRTSVFKLMTELITEYDISGKFVINKTEMSIKCATGSYMITSGLNDVEKLKSIANINRIWVEEASEISEKDYQQLDLRMRGQSAIGYQMTLSFNPISELHWIKQLFFDVGVEDAFILKSTYLNNRFLDDNYIKKLKSLKHQDYQFYRIYCLGEWGSLGNLIYRNWEKADLSEQKASFDNIYNGLDFGFADHPTAFIRCHLDKTRKIIYVFDELYRTELHIDELAEKIKEKQIGNQVVWCDCAEPRSIDALKREGINTRKVKKGADSVSYGIDWIKGHKIIIDESCYNIIKELSMYKWKEDSYGNVLPKPVKLNDDALDALRYALEDESLQKESIIFA